ncbi:hypothetical protein M5D96_007851 [Drosophila gunungcola]|uniref:Uncharacterized protein n=1 Tax=Drosophila gunungcola TaxID=103775 RepID=A0A9P9YMF0_9MUSC|nr:hypothetical protein M5D96_007851 [Drosophila gunungcola]
MMTARQQGDWQAGSELGLELQKRKEEENRTTSMSQAAANNNHNSQQLVVDGIVNQGKISTTMTRRGQVATSSPVEQAPQEFPIIKKQFVSFPNYRAMLSQDGPEYHPPAAATTTMTQLPGLGKVTKIEDGVHKVVLLLPTVDNELEAVHAVEALNLNVAREIEHQQAENLNDAFGQRRHDHKNDDAMDGAKNKRRNSEICEQSKLKKAAEEDHNEANMRDRSGGEQQSICLAREQTIDGNQYQNRNSNHQQSGDLSDACESSPEQVDVQLGRQLTRERNPPPNRTLPNIELLKSSVRAFLAEYSSPRLKLNRDWESDWDWDWELLDLLTQSIELICGQADTGNLWSEAAVVGADMTVSKVSEERETESVEVYPEQLDQPSELDDKNNNSGNIEASSLPTNDMKYEMKSARSSSRSPQIVSPVSRISSSATSRIRNVEASVPTTTATTTRAPLLGEIKRSSITSRDTISSSIDADSVLPERTRLRRQRRVRSQDSVEEKPEDVIERLNKLKARISGALSEVKGVLKQYSTESEAESATEQSQVGSDGGAGDPAPVSFRFVKKVRRRSYFDEAEEEKEQAGEEQEHENQTNKTEPSREDKKEQDALKTNESTESTQPPSKIKKKVIVKVKNPRRASIAAVEPSKIKVEPAVEQTDALITQRRPSDSEAIVKRKKKLKLMGTGTDTAATLVSTAKSERTSLKLAELVGETVLVVPAAAAAATAAAAAATAAAAAAAAVATPGPKESKEAIKQVAIAADIVPQIAAVAATATLNHEESSSSTPEQQPTPVEATKAGEQAPPGDSLASMPELKVLAGPVQPVKIETVEQPHDVAKNQEPLVKKKAPVHLKKLVRKNSIDKDPQEKQKQEKQDSSKLSNILRDRNKINELSSRINKLTPPKKQAKPAKEEGNKAAVADRKPEDEVAAPLEEAPTENQADEEVSEEPEVEPTPEPKKPRKIKKKVIIKRQKRRLSIGDTFFLQPEPEEPTIPEVETIERAIAYVTDDEEDTVAPEQEPEPIKAPLKSCLHVREYKIGDLVLYAERYRKTQVRWKRGRVLERITSISYKLEIEGKEVPAHVSYIKKYTGRKVRFGGKEYLEIDYEQVAEEERRAASYSIWNMV